jgi:membrane protease subunit (stomatin/prohibitin family)
LGLFDKIRGELIDIIEWTQPTDRGILAFRFPRYDKEIKMGAKLTVREGQAAVFVNEGKIADVFKPGMYTLTTQNMPVLSTLKGWKYGFESPYKAEVYFINVAQQPDYKWGTSNPITMRDADFGIVRIRGFGSYVFRVADPALFLRELVATDPCFEDYEIDAQLRQVVVARFSDVLGKFVLDLIKPEFAGWGLEIVKFYIENLSLPPAVEEAIDRRGAMGAVGDLTKYTQFQVAESIRAAAENPSGGAAAAGIGLGAGLGMAQAVQQSLGVNQVGRGDSGPPPVPGAGMAAPFHVAVDGRPSAPLGLDALRQQVTSGAVTRESLIWRQGMSQWVRAGEVSELASLFAAVPPPLPPR